MDLNMLKWTDPKVIAKVLGLNPAKVVPVGWVNLEGNGNVSLRREVVVDKEKASTALGGDALLMIEIGVPYFVSALVVVSVALFIYRPRSKAKSEASMRTGRASSSDDEQEEILVDTVE
jgi:hypothetical protein